MHELSELVTVREPAGAVWSDCVRGFEKCVRGLGVGHGVGSGREFFQYCRLAWNVVVTQKNDYQKQRYSAYVFGAGQRKEIDITTTDAMNALLCAYKSAAEARMGLPVHSLGLSVDGFAGTRDEATSEESDDEEGSERVPLRSIGPAYRTRV